MIYMVPSEFMLNTLVMVVTEFMMNNSPESRILAEMLQLRGGNAIIYIHRPSHTPSLGLICSFHI